MPNTKALKDLPKHFQEEEKQLLKHGINNWISLKNLKDEDLFTIAQEGLATTKNLMRLRGMARLITEIKISQSEAALLLHSGIASSKALASLTPLEVIKKTERLKRQLYKENGNLIDLAKANSWVKKAKRANRELTQ